MSIAGGTESVEQSCYYFDSWEWYINTYDDPTKLEYVCTIKANLENDQEEVTTDTSKNTKSNDEVTVVYYYEDNNVKFIPNSLFSTFTNLEYLLISWNNNFETMKQEYLRNATKLKCLKITDNLVKKLDKNVFSEAKNLEHINFMDNKIETIHKKAFNGLPKLQGVYLHKNRIKSLNPYTFSFIIKLNILELTGAENCVNDKFLNATCQFPEIEREILQSCTYEPFPDEVLEESEYQKILNIKLNKANDMINNLTAVAQDFVAKIANQLIEMVSGKIQMETKITDEWTLIHYYHFLLS